MCPLFGVVTGHTPFAKALRKVNSFVVHHVCALAGMFTLETPFQKPMGVSEWAVAVHVAEVDGTRDRPRRPEGRWVPCGPRTPGPRSPCRRPGWLPDSMRTSLTPLVKGLEKVQYSVFLQVYRLFGMPTLRTPFWKPK